MLWQSKQKKLKRTLYQKFVEWLKRYLPAEILAITGALVIGGLAHIIFQNGAVTALAGTWGENIGFYGKILYEDIRKRKQKDERITFIGMLKVLRGIIVEFGAGEYLDSFVIRPGAMYVFPKLLGSTFWGLLVGKLTADITFYLPTVISYELKKKYLKD
ncbi:hypothetical protein GF362_01910 [Candidatus Dojkabacteria bacterium]|nr:hypothetical protein [Candidatus Dojkabacteria bacterium]